MDWVFGVGIAGIAWSAYFDDYSTITRPELEASTRWVLTTLFELTGLLYAKEGPKAPPCNAVFKMLGLVVDLQGIPSKPFFVTHTAERRAELKQCLEEITQTKVRFCPKRLRESEGACCSLSVSFAEEWPIWI